MQFFASDSQTMLATSITTVLFRTLPVHYWADKTHLATLIFPFSTKNTFLLWLKLAQRLIIIWILWNFVVVWFSKIKRLFLAQESSEKLKVSQLMSFSYKGMECSLFYLSEYRGILSQFNLYNQRPLKIFFCLLLCVQPFLRINIMHKSCTSFVSFL